VLNGFHPIIFRDPVTGGSFGRWAPARPRRRLLALLLASASLGAGSAHAVDGTWLAAPATNNWNTGTNWSSSPVVPTGTASFGASTKTALAFSADTSIGNLQFNVGAPIYSFDLSGHNWSIGGNNLNTFINGTISDSGVGGTLTKTGTGTLTLSGNSTYAGVSTFNPFGLFFYNNGTTVTGGTLEIANVNALGTGAVTLSGGTLRSTITGTIANSVLSDSNTTNTISAAAGKTLTLGPNGGTATYSSAPAA
jgi:autotransporter-associated beta strand protein